MATLSYTVSPVVTDSILRVNLLENEGGQCAYHIKDEEGKLYLYGNIEGKINSTCLYVGNLTGGKYYFQIDEYPMVDFTVQSAANF
jgi:hypothetical protein